MIAREETEIRSNQKSRTTATLKKYLDRNQTHPLTSLFHCLNVEILTASLKCITIIENLIMSNNIFPTRQMFI